MDNKLSKTSGAANNCNNHSKLNKEYNYLGFRVIYIFINII